MSRTIIPGRRHASDRRGKGGTDGEKVELDLSPETKERLAQVCATLGCSADAWVMAQMGEAR